MDVRARGDEVRSILDVGGTLEAELMGMRAIGESVSLRLEITTPRLLFSILLRTEPGQDARLVELLAAAGIGRSVHLEG